MPGDAAKYRVVPAKAATPVSSAVRRACSNPREVISERTSARAILPELVITVRPGDNPDEARPVLLLMDGILLSAATGTTLRRPCVTVSHRFRSIFLNTCRPAATPGNIL
jgi:hypothetical protein